MFIFSNIFTYFHIVIWMISKFLGAHNPGLVISIWFTAYTKVMSLRAKLVAGAQGLRELYAAWHGRVAAARGENGATAGLQFLLGQWWSWIIIWWSWCIWQKIMFFFFSGETGDSAWKLGVSKYQMAIVRHSQMESNGGVQGWVIALQGCVASNRWGKHI